MKELCISAFCFLALGLSFAIKSNSSTVKYPVEPAKLEAITPDKDYWKKTLQ